MPVAPHLRQPGEPAARARGGARARAGGARGARRGQGAAGAAADHRERDPDAARRRGRRRRGRREPPAVFQPRAAHAADRQSARRWTCACSSWRRCSRRSPAWGSACFPRCARPPHGVRRAARRQPRRRRPQAARPRRAGDRRSHHVGDPADHIRPLDPRRVARAGHRPGIRVSERAHAQDGVAATEVRQPGASRRVLRAGAGGRARAARRPERGVHHRPADGDDRRHHRRRGPGSGRAERAEAAA